MGCLLANGVEMGVVDASITEVDERKDGFLWRRNGVIVGFASDEKRNWRAFQIIGVRVRYLTFKVD